MLQISGLALEAEPLTGPWNSSSKWEPWFRQTCTALHHICSYCFCLSFFICALWVLFVFVWRKHSPEWPRTHRCLSASASQDLRSKAGAAMPGLRHLLIATPIAKAAVASTFLSSCYLLSPFCQELKADKTPVWRERWGFGDIGGL